MSAHEIVIMGKMTVAAIKNDGEPNARGERCHENPMQSVARYLPKSFKVNRADSIVESAFTIAIGILYLPTCRSARETVSTHECGFKDI